jgi:hypothetical protein
LYYLSIDFNPDGVSEYTWEEKSVNDLQVIVDKAMAVCKKARDVFSSLLK